MNQQLKNELTASFIRQLYFSKMLNKEHEHFLKFPAPSNVKNILKRLKDNYANGINQLGSALAVKELNQSDEKLNALTNIFEKLAMMEEEDLLKLETTFDELIKVDYNTCN